MQIKQSQISLESIRFPRELEADNTAEIIRQALIADAGLLRQESDFVVPRIETNKFLKTALRRARLQGHIRCGFDAIASKLESERAGISDVCKRKNVPYGKRISRLLLFSNDGAPRFYRHIEQLLTIHASRLLGCLLNIDSETFGYLITDKESKIKIIMVENKVAVCEVLRALKPAG